MNEENLWDIVKTGGSAAPRRVQKLLDQGANPNLTREDGWTILMEAAHCGRGENAKVLLSAGANPNTAKGYGWTALMSAAFQGHFEVVQILLDMGANRNAALKSDWTALSVANEAWSSATPKDAKMFQAIVNMLQGKKAE